MFLHQKFPKSLFSSNFAYNTGHFNDFLRKKRFCPKNAPAYRALFWLFCPIIHCLFTPKIPKKLIFPKIATIIQGTLLTFLPKKVIFYSNCACIWSTNLTFLPNNPVCFYNTCIFAQTIRFWDKITQFLTKSYKITENNHTKTRKKEKFDVKLRRTPGVHFTSFYGIYQLIKSKIASNIHYNIDNKIPNNKKMSSKMAPKQ